MKKLNEQLYYDIEYNNIGQVKAALADGINIRAVNERGQTVLHVAIIWGRFEIINLLLDKVQNIKFTGEIKIYRKASP